MQNDRSTYLQLPLPHEDNLLEDDVSRLREALLLLDTTLQNIAGTLASDDPSLDTVQELVTVLKNHAVALDKLQSGKASAEDMAKALQDVNASIVVAQNAANAANTAAVGAQGAANAAQGTANAANTAAAGAQNTANAAQTAANAAQNTANAAKSTADNALTLANSRSTILIGVPMPYPSTVLQTGFMWADGTLALFSDWPEFFAKYNAGGFSGMVLPAGTSQATMNQYMGKFCLNANGTGLYLPRLGGQFVRNWVPGNGEAGRWYRDEIRNITGMLDGYGRYRSSSGAFYTPESYNQEYSTVLAMATFKLIANLDTSRVVNTGPENVPPHVRQPMVIYLGRHA